ncbi:MAG: DPP IV N-terminal domain-containing protein [Bacteroidales bacterium]|nr:DPP IV N-terminal domain-containing protein [Bacteroidales bacterium]
MKRTILLIAMLCFTVSSIFAQEKKMLTANDAAYMNRSLYPVGKSVNWLPNSDKYLFTDNENPNNLMIQDVNAEKAEVLITLDQVNSYLNQAGLDSIRRLPNLTWIDATKAYYYSFDQKNNCVNLNLLDIDANNIKKVTSVPSNAENHTITLPSLKVAYTIENNLYFADGDRQVQVTDNPENVVAGQSVHRNEFAINGGIFWSPDGNKLAYYNMDESMVTDYPLVDITERVATAKPIKYPMAGMKSHEVKLHVYDIASGNDLMIKTGEPAEQYLTSITWNPDNERVYIGVLNRGQNHLQFNEYNALNGEYLQTIFEDKDEQYVEPVGPAHFLPNSTNEFLWIAQRDGFYHIWKHNINNKKAKQITKGEFVITAFNGFDAKGENIYYTSTEVSPLERHYYKHNLKNGKKVKITKEHGTHSVKPSASGKYFIDTYSSTDVANNVDIADAKGNFIKRLHEAVDPLKDYNIGTIELGELKAEDGQTLYTRMIKPYNFDESKKYPVIIYVYGGPHAQMITDNWTADAGIYLHYLSQEGFIVFTLDNRGSADRGEAFEQVIHRQCGQAEMRDQKVGIDYLKSLPYVDAERIGTDGWSYGGFMSTNMKIHYPEDVKVSTAGGPVMDWKYYEIMYGERYMDTPEENPEGYELTSLENKTDKLEGKLMIIHCTTDPVVVWQHSLVFVENCIHNGKQLDYFVYPGHDHNVYGPDRAHLVTKITEYFKANL